MRATVEYVEQRFAHFNVMIFDGKLPPVSVRLSGARTFLGKICYTEHGKLIGRREISDIQLVVSDRFDVPESMLDDTIVHEMIHYYILCNRIEDTSVHGEVFCKMMDDINFRYGLNITIRVKLPQEIRESDDKIRMHTICAIYFKDGTTGIMLAARTRFFELKKQLSYVSSIDRCEWYVSSNPFFNRFPRSIKLKIYCISEQELKHNLLGAYSLG